MGHLRPLIGVRIITTITIYRNLLLLLYAGLALTIAVAWRWPLLGSRLFNRIESLGSRLGRRRLVAAATVAALVVVLRLSLLPVLPTPVPETHDEFCHLLAADTFAHGRLTNPTHPMWRYLETFHVNQSPTYMSIFPPGQGAVLALGQLLGSPWIGVVLSVAIMCGAITWALQGWMPSRWAFLGGIIAVAQFGAANYWMESYWGGAVAAIGGALVIGALPRILRHQRPKDAILLALGAGILANTRPYEGLIFFLAVLAFGVWLHRKNKLSWSVTLRRVVVPAAMVLILAGAFVAYYNWRLTGNPFLLPWALGFRTSFSSPVFLWGKLRPPLHYDNPQFETYYRRAREGWLLLSTWPGFKHALFAKSATMMNFYSPPQLLVPILVSLFAIGKNWKLQFAFVITLLVFVGTLAVPTYAPHYLAALTTGIYVLIVFGFRYINCWRFRGRPVGVGLVRALVLLHVALLPAQVGARSLMRHSRPSEAGVFARARAAIEDRLERIPGKSLVIVRYSPGHDVALGDWVYNRADIDRAKVVWAREIPGQKLDALLDYFAGSEVWVADPDALPPALSKYIDDRR